MQNNNLGTLTYYYVKFINTKLMEDKTSNQLLIFGKFFYVIFEKCQYFKLLQNNDL